MSTSIYSKTVYDDNGNLVAAVEPIVGGSEIHRTWTGSGLLTMEARFENGKYNGSYRSWWDNGALKEEGSFVNGNKVGIYKWYNDNGELSNEHNYR